MKAVFIGLPVCCLSTPALGALVGYGIWPYNPLCAFACDRALSTFMLSCSTSMSPGMSMSGDAAMASPQCRADDTPWLTTLAWCVHVQCAEDKVRTSELESFWESQSTGDPSVAPKSDYSTTLLSISQPPNQTVTDPDESLNFTALVDPTSYLSQYNALKAVQRENVVESAFG